MKSLAVFAVVLIGWTTGMAAGASDFSDAFDRVRGVWNNVYSFQENAWTAIDDSLASGDTTELDNFYNNQVPQEIVDAGKTAFGQLFPNTVSAVLGQWSDAKTTWENTLKLDALLEQAASHAQNAAQAKLDSPSATSADLTDQISDYFTAGSSQAPQRGNACPIFTNGVCPSCPYGGSMDANGNCPVPGLEADADDQKYLSQTSTGMISASSALSSSSFLSGGPAQVPSSSIHAADLQAIGARNTSTAPSTTLAGAAEQVRQELAEIERRRAAAAAAAAEAARQQKFQRQQELARQQQEAVLQAGHANRPTALQSSPKEGSSCPYKSKCEQCLANNRRMFPGNDESAFRQLCQPQCEGPDASDCGVFFPGSEY